MNGYTSAGRYSSNARGTLRAAAVATMLVGAVIAPAQTTRPVIRYGEARAVCTLSDRRITEASGIVASRRTPEYYYVHNDSGGKPRVFLIDRTGRTRLTVVLKNARNVDWEDIALAPGDKPGMFDVCVADIGDNPARRDELIVYRFPEVDLEATRGDVFETSARSYRFTYADGPSDAEAFIVHPRTGDGYVLTKRPDGTSRVYELAAPWVSGERIVLPKVATIRVSKAIPLEAMVTAADVSPDGTRVATRSYVCGWEWRLRNETPGREFERVFDVEPTRLELAPEPQGEAICYSADGTALLTVSEKRPTVLYECRRLDSGD